MPDQSFSAENFRQILELENRKGVYLEGLFFPELKQITEEIKQCNNDIKQKIKSKDKESLVELNKKRNDLKISREGNLMAKLQIVSNKVVEPSFCVALEKKDMPTGKPLYIVKDLPEYYFTMKQIQNNVAKLFGVKQSNRFEIVSQVKILLGDEFPKYVIRTDVDDFYESIPHASLVNKINGDNLLTPFSRRVLWQILNKYKVLSGSDKGIPRGIGVSAYLAELYMRDVDKDIMALPGISYYARYVDDIIIIFTPEVTGEKRVYLNEVKEIIETKYGLKLNTDPAKSSKTVEFILPEDSLSFQLEYLGYKFSFKNGNIAASLTSKKINKYRNRINLAFDNYLNFSKVNEKEARKLLVKRLRFLTGNTRLKNNKSNALVGVYYSNSHLTEKDDLTSLDDYLRSKINSVIASVHLKERLKKYSFKEGFETKRFSPFKTNELSKIVKVWK